MITGNHPQPAYGAVDVHYPPDGGARAALVVAEDARFAAITGEFVARVDQVSTYRPGHFSERELPAVQVVLDGRVPRLLVIDGYVDLDPQGRPGLGAHTHAALGVPVIGIAKTAFATATHAVAVRRGSATRPLYVTAAGLDLDLAADLVSAMAGPFRIPDALRRVDALARGHAVRSPGRAATSRPR